MKERRPLIAGLRPDNVPDRAVEKEFVYGEKPPPEPATASLAPPEAKQNDGQGGTVRRVPLTTRIREDFSKALKRASLERQLSGQEPHTMLDILEEALEPWLRRHGYLN